MTLISSLSTLVDNETFREKVIAKRAPQKRAMASLEPKVSGIARELHTSGD